MSVAGFGAKAKAWRDNKPRSLREAARAAAGIAEREHLPIAAAVGGDVLRWHAEAMLKTIPVHGTKNGRPGLAAAAGLDADLASVSTGWRDLTVERRDFDSYLAWLRTVW